MAAEGDDKILAVGSDILGIFHMIRMGGGVYLRLVGALALIIGSSACVMASARLLGKIVEALLHSSGQADVHVLALGFLSLECLSVACQYCGRVTLARATIAIILKVRSELFDKMRRLPISYFDTQPLGRTITRLTSDVEGIETFFSGTLARVLIAVINIAAVMGAMLLTDLRFGAMIVGVCIPALLFSVALRRPVIFWLRTYKKRAAHINAKLAEFLSGLPVIKIFGLEDWTDGQYGEAAASLLSAGIHTLNWNSFIRPVAVFLCSLPTVLTLWLGGERVLAGTMEIGLLVAFVRFGERFVSPIRVISTEIQNIQEAVVSSERVRRMLLEPEEVTTLGPNGSLRPTLLGGVEFRDVWMQYGDKPPVLKGISFSAQPGMKIGLVGATGSGKTTTVNLIPRLYPISAGQILLDQIDVATIEREALRRQIGYVSQDVMIFAGTLRDNLLATAGSVRPDDSQILAACAKTGLAELVANVSGGLDHVILDGGDNLSMGERQLIAFTRMLLLSPAILILDEATANIDEHCERLIQRATFELMTGRTCFIIAHRLSTILQCDKILVFAGGQIVEQGTHTALMAADAYYARLANQQLAAPPPEAPQ